MEFSLNIPSKFVGGRLLGISGSQCWFEEAFLFEVIIDQIVTVSRGWRVYGNESDKKLASRPEK